MIDTAFFVGAVVAGVTEFIRLLSPKVQGPVTVAVAALVGVLVALVDTQVGVADVTIAQGLVIGLATAGVVGTVKKVG